MKKRQLNIVISEQMLKGSDRAIELGYAMNRSDFIRAAIGKQLQELSIIQEMKEREK